ncbi:MAG: helix-turn-helix domain-containing protein [Elusimicrobiaceae bacterium]|nr:helix-turn-helix domain-containing protein [Elusimicrobiaceae bacterium]
MDRQRLYIPLKKIEVKERYPLEFKPWKKEFSNEYFPEVSVKNDTHYGLELLIQYSHSKILYGNNLLEASPGLLRECTEQLCEKLEKMGIKAPFEVLWEHSTMSALEIGKNINLDSLPAWVVVDYLKKFPAPCGYMDPAEDYYHSQTRNNQCRFYSRSHEVTFYNKTQELQDKLQQNMEGFFFCRPNILRFEVRLNKSALKTLFGKTAISLSDLAAKKDCYEEVVEKYWNPFVKASKHNPIYLSPQAQLAQVKSHLKPQSYINLLAFKEMEYREGFCYTKCFFEREIGKQETHNIIACYKRYPILNIVDNKYDIIDKLDYAISHPRWWLKMEDIFKPNERPFEFSQCLVEDWWTTADSSEYLGICERAVQNKCRSGEIPSFFVGGKYRLKKADVMNYQYQQKLIKKTPNTL